MPRVIFYSGFVLLSAWPSILAAAIDYSSIGFTYSQNFNSLAASGTDHDWANDSTIVGWHLFRVTANNNATPFPMAFYDSTNGSARYCGISVLLGNYFLAA